MNRSLFQTFALLSLYSVVACDSPASAPSTQPESNQGQPGAGDQADKPADEAAKPGTEDNPKKGQPESESEPEAKPEANPEKEAEVLPPNFAISAATLAGTLCEGAGEKGNGKQTVIITNEEPGQPINYFQVTFDALEVSSESNRNKGDCIVNIFAEWTPGHRLIVDSFELDGTTSTKHDDGEGKANLALKLRSGYSSSIERSRSFSGTDGEEYKERLESGTEKIYSSCTGSGVFSFKMQLDIQVDEQGESIATVDQASGLFRFAKPGEVPDC